jgi:colanic acid/amylovoran biosynthesis glycosyltransferase
MDKDFEQKNLRVAIFSPNRSAISETFIKAHIERLPFKIVPFYGNQLGVEDRDGKRIWIGGELFTQAASRLLPRTNQWVCTRLLARLLKCKRVDAVLAEYGTTGAYLAPACERVGIPLFVHFHGFDASVVEVLERNRDGYGKIFESAAGIVSVSERMRDRLRLLGAPENRLYLNHYGVDSEQFANADPANSEPKFFAVGRFVEKKAPYLTILAFSRVVTEVPNATLTVVGAGPLLGPCKRLVQALRLEDSIQLLGAQEPDVVKKHMSSARAFVQHSLVADNGDSEGTPVAVIEAQMSGLPVISTDHAGIPDVVINEETGIIVDEADLDGMAKAMLRIAKDPQLAGRLGSAARERAIENFTMERHIGDLAQMITEGVSRRMK